MLKRVNVEKQLVKERNNRNEFISNVVSEIFENVTAEDDKILNGRLILLSSIKIVLINGLNLLGVSSPDKM